MKRTSFRFAVAYLCVCAFAGSTWAQFPKIPKVLKKLPGQSKPDDAKSPQGPMPELTSVTPDNAPPGGSGDLILVGKTFAEGLRLRIGCKDYQNIHIDTIKIENRERAIAHVTIPDSVPEGTCEFFLEFVRGVDGEIMPSTEGTPEVVQARAITFAISNTSTSFPVGLGEYSLLSDEDLNDIATMAKTQAESQKLAADMQAGKVNMMDPDFIKKMQANAVLMTKMAQRAQKPQQDGAKGSLLLKGGSVSFVLAGKTIFDQPVSKLKEITEIQAIFGSGGTVYRFEFSDGKAYGLKPPQSNHVALDELKKKLGK
jgi:hypothetical protein